MAEIEIVVDIDAEGNAQVAVRGVAGPRCLELTRELEGSLGIVRSRKHTEEYFEVEAVAEQEERERTGF